MEIVSGIIEWEQRSKWKAFDPTFCNPAQDSYQNIHEISVCVISGTVNDYYVCVLTVMPSSHTKCMCVFTYTLLCIKFDRFYCEIIFTYM